MTDDELRELADEDHWTRGTEWPPLPMVLAAEVLRLRSLLDKTADGIIGEGLIAWGDELRAKIRPEPKT